MTARWNSPEWPTPSGHPFEGVRREAGARGPPYHCPLETLHRPAPALQRRYVPQRQITGRAQTRVGGWVWTSPDGVRHLGRPPRGWDELGEGDLRTMHRSVARQLEDPMMASTQTPAWLAATLPATTAFTAAGNPQWRAPGWEPPPARCGGPRARREPPPASSGAAPPT